MQEYDLIVIGGVAAGTKAAAKTRREKRDWKILIITQETDVSYAGCGLPYYLGGVIQTRNALVVKTPDKLCSVSDLEIKTGHRATAINRDAHTVKIQNLATGDIAELKYKKLFLATGARPLVPPIPGADLDGVMTLRNVADADRILEKLNSVTKGRAVIVGGGFIGVEVAENMIERGWEATIVEMLPQILPPFDDDVALYIQTHIEKKGVTVRTGTAVKSISKSETGLEVEAGDTRIPADLVIMSIGVKPNSELAKEAGLELGVRGAIKVDKFGRTADPDIFASGDCATTVGLVSGNEAWSPMGSTANKQARMAALTLTGQEDDFPGVLGTIVVKAFDASVARTGLSEREAVNAGYEIVSALVPADDTAHYYPGSEKIAIKIIAEKGSGRILGAMVYGFGAVDKPVDVIVTAITMHATVHDLANADFAYAPPFSTAINPVNLACHVLINKMQGKVEGTCCIRAHNMVNSPDWDGLILDTREVPEFMLGSLPGAINIPLVELKTRLSEIENFKDRQVLVVCNFGKNAYDGYLRLKHLGFNRVKILEGGTRFWPYELE